MPGQVPDRGGQPTTQCIHMSTQVMGGVLLYLFYCRTSLHAAGSGRLYTLLSSSSLGLGDLTMLSVARAL